MRKEQLIQLQPRILKKSKYKLFQFLKTCKIISYYFSRGILTLHNTNIICDNICCPIKTIITCGNHNHNMQDELTKIIQNNYTRPPYSDIHPESIKSTTFALHKNTLPQTLVVYPSYPTIPPVHQNRYTNPSSSCIARQKMTFFSHCTTSRVIVGFTRYNEMTPQ